eukprot:scaffold66297_cov69-Phaeocystis_antarctica.AAC.1
MRLPCRWQPAWQRWLVRRRLRADRGRARQARSRQADVKQADIAHDSCGFRLVRVELAPQPAPQPAAGSVRVAERPPPFTSHAQGAADARRALPRAVLACYEPAAPAAP